MVCLPLASVKEVGLGFFNVIDFKDTRFSMHNAANHFTYSRYIILFHL